MKHWILTQTPLYSSLQLETGKVNEVGEEALAELEMVLGILENAPPRMVKLFSEKRSSKGTPCFCAGANFRERANWNNQRIAEHLKWQRSLLMRFRALSSYTVACVEGAALGLGVELCLVCDDVLATSAALFGLPEVRRGIIPGAGGSAWLSMVSNRLAWRYALSGETITAEKALQCGWVSEICESHESLEMRFQDIVSEYSLGNIDSQRSLKEMRIKTCMQI